MVFKFLPLIAFIALILFCGNSFAATISGTIYDAVTLEPLSNAIIDVNSIPSQQIVSKNGNYSIILPNGDFEIKAVFFGKGQGFKLTADENFAVVSDGNFILDLLLFPDFESNGENQSTQVIGSGTIPKNPPSNGLLNFNLFQWLLIGLMFAAIASISWKLLPAVFSKKENPNPIQQNPPRQKQDSVEKLDKHALEVLDILKRSGNRLTQKELREKIDSIGEAKISLIISELEHAGKIKKIKKGRGNIIVLKNP